MCNDETLEISFDLVWSVDLKRDPLKGPDEDAKQIAAEITAGLNFLAWMQRHFQTGALSCAAPSTGLSVADDAIQSLNSWIKWASKQGRGMSPKFFENREASLLDPILNIWSESMPTRRYEAMSPWD